MTRLTYLTLDEVNRNHANILASKCGATLVPSESEEANIVDACVVDLDHQGTSDYIALAQSLIHSASTTFTIVHTYRLERLPNAHLTDYGYVVVRTLEEAMLLLFPRKTNQLPIHVSMIEPSCLLLEDFGLANY